LALLLALATCSLSCSDVEATYKFPDTSGGFVVAQDRISVALAIEVWDWHRCTGDVVLAEDLGAIAVSWRITSMYEIKLGAVCGWDFNLQEVVWGGTFLMTEF